MGSSTSSKETINHKLDKIGISCVSMTSYYKESNLDVRKCIDINASFQLRY